MIMFHTFESNIRDWETLEHFAFQTDAKIRAYEHGPNGYADSCVKPALTTTTL